MRLHRLKLVNFRLHADTEILFGPGLTAIIGPNGSGKTTILEGIAWAFYGNTATRGSKDSVRRTGAPARAQVRVELEFGLGAHEYRLVRGLNRAELYQDGAGAPTANSQQSVSAKIERLFGMTRAEFFNTYFTGQKELTVMANLGPTDRAKFLSRLLGYERLREAQDLLRMRRSTLRAEIAGVERGLEDRETLAGEMDEARALSKKSDTVLKEAQKADIAGQNSLKALEPEWKRLLDLRESIIHLAGEQKIAEERVSEARRQFERLDRELAEALRAKDELVKLDADVQRIEALERDLRVLDREAEAATLHRDIVGQLKEVAGEVARLDEQLAAWGDSDDIVEQAMKTLEQSRLMLEDARRVEEQTRTDWVRDRQDAETKRQTYRDQFRILRTDREAIVDAGPQGACPTCRRPLESEFEGVLQTLERQLEEVEARGKFFKQRYEQLQSEPESLAELVRACSEQSTVVDKQTRALAESEALVRRVRDAHTDRHRLLHRREALEKQLAELPGTYDAKKHDEVRERVRALANIHKQVASLQVRAERGETLVADAEIAEKHLSECEQRLQHIANAIAEAGFSEDTYLRVKSQFESVQNDCRRAEVAVAKAEGDVKAAAAGLKAVERRMHERDKRSKIVEQQRGELSLHDELDGAFDSLRAELNARMRPDLSDLASNFLSDLTDGRYAELEIDEQYRITIVEDGVAKQVISGGEEDIANLVMRLAISQMVAERAGQPLSLLVLDEIFGSLDEARRANVISLLRALGDRFPQVILISHIEGVRDGVDRVLRVSIDPQAQTAVVREEVESANAEHAAA